MTNMLDALNGARAFLASRLDPKFLVGSGTRAVVVVPQPLAE